MATPAPVAVPAVPVTYVLELMSGRGMPPESPARWVAKEAMSVPASRGRALEWSSGVACGTRAAGVNSTTEGCTRVSSPSRRGRKDGRGRGFKDFFMYTLPLVKMQVPENDRREPVRSASAAGCEYTGGLRIGKNG